MFLDFKLDDPNLEETLIQVPTSNIVWTQLKKKRFFVLPYSESTLPTQLLYHLVVFGKYVSSRKNFSSISFQSISHSKNQLDWQLLLEQY